MEHFSSNGIIRITRKIYWYRGEGRDARLDRWLGIQDNNVSVAAREMCCRSSVGGIGFVKAAEVLERLGSIRISKEWMREIVESEGRRVSEGRKLGTLRPDWASDDCAVTEGGSTRVMVGIDGVMVPVVTEVEKQKRREKLARKRKAKRGRRSKARTCRLNRLGENEKYKEFKIGAFYDESRQHQYAFGTAGKHEEFGRQLRKEAAKIRLDLADEKISLTDGAEWIRRQAMRQLPMLDAMLLDFFHFTEHVSTAARACFGEGSVQAKSWKGQLLGLALEQGPVEVLTRIQETLCTARSAGKRKALKGLQQYVAKRVEMMDYPTFRQKGFDIGSGPTEAFCKTLTARLKGSGMKWDKANAEAMMALAAIDQCNLWKYYWSQELARAA